MKKPPPIGSTATEIMTRDEVAAWLKIKPREVQRKGVPFIDLGGKTQRYLRDDVLRWLEERRHGRTDRKAS